MMRTHAVVSFLALMCQCAAAAGPEAGPVGEKTPKAKWGAVVHDAVNDEHVWFGGAGGVMAEKRVLLTKYEQQARRREERVSSSKYEWQARPRHVRRIPPPGQLH